ncbi:MAG: M20/M25/M40 family metallo-hydrolase, partial [Alphaproteobacteria bacterium]|nr:M20/M25/M40 family metallo-hydrolase [Alphaproteobacteria bacterium]
ADGAGPAFAPEQARAANALIDRALKDDVAWTFVEGLTTEIGPRLAGSSEERRARDWAAAKLKKMGFKNVRIETFDIPYWARVRDKAAIVSPFPQPLRIAALGRSVATPEGGVTAEVVRFPTLAALKAAPMTGLEGKIVFVDEKMPRTQDGSGYGHAVAMRSGAANEAGRRGAAAALIRSVGTDESRNPHAGGMRYEEGVREIPAAALSTVDADQLARAIERAKGPVTVSLDIAVETKPLVQSGNVIAEIPGKSDDIVLVGAHLDSWDLGTGAIDDAAGAAVVSAAARLVGAMKGKPKRTIRVVLFGAEEFGLLGAKAYVAAHKATDLDRHYFAAESDFGAGVIWRFKTAVAEDALPKITEITDILRRLKIDPGENDSDGGSDVSELKNAGVPVGELAQNGWRYFDYHHTADDTLDKIDPEALRQNVAAYAATIYLMSEMPGSLRAPAQ